MLRMEDAKEYTEMVLNDIGEQYNINTEELTNRYLYEENGNNKENKPIVKFTKSIVNNVIFFTDVYGNIYNEKFEYIEKEENNRKRTKKAKKK